MTAQHAWRRVWAAPDDQEARHVLIDALLEAGDPFGEFMSLTAEKHLGKTSAKLEARLVELEAAREARLAPASAFFSACLDDEMGLPREVHCSVAQLRKGFDALLALGPKLTLVLGLDRLSPSELRALGQLDLGRFFAVKVRSAYEPVTDAVKATTVERLMLALSKVSRLRLEHLTTTRALIALAANRKVPLRELGLPRPEAEAEQIELVKVLATHASFRSLEALSISGSMPKKLIASLQGLPKLRSLWVARTIPLGPPKELISAARAGKTALLAKLIAQGAPIDATGGDEGSNALHEACSEARKDAVLLLLKHDADVTIADRHGRLPMHLALSARLNIGGRELEDRVAIAQALIKAGSPLDTLDPSGLSVLAMACELGRGKATGLVEKLLASNPALLSVRSRNDRTVIHHAAAYGHVAVIKAALAAKIGINEVDADGNTALHLASGEGQRAAAFFLLDHGADGRILSRAKRTAAQVSRATDKVLRKRLQEAAGTVVGAGGSVWG